MLGEIRVCCPTPSRGDGGGRSMPVVTPGTADTKAGERPKSRALTLGWVLRSFAWSAVMMFRGGR